MLFLKICFNKVVLPTPFVPIIATLSLDFISKFTFCKSTSSNDIPKSSVFNATISSSISLFVSKLIYGCLISTNGCLILFASNLSCILTLAFNALPLDASAL